MSFDSHVSDKWCARNADEELKLALCSENQSRLRKWCRDNPNKLRLALDWIHSEHTIYRNIVSLEIDDIRRKEQEEKYKEIHRKITALEKPHWTTTLGFLISVISFLFLLLATYFAWLAIPLEHRPFFRGRSSENSSSSLSPAQPDTDQGQAQQE